MSLSDIMSHTDLSWFAEVGLVISFLVFSGIIVWAFCRPEREMQEHALRAIQPEETAAPGERQEHNQ